MAIAFDNATSAVSTSGVKTLTWSHTITGTDNILIVGTTEEQGITSVTYNGVSLTLVDTLTPNNDTESAWVLLNAPAGTANIVVTVTNFTGAHNWITGVACSYSGTNIISQPDSYHDGSTTGAGTANLSNTTSTTVVASNCWLVGIGFGQTNNSSPGPGTYFSSNKTDRILQDGAYGASAENNIFIFDSNGTIGTGSQSATVSSSVHAVSAGMILMSIASDITSTNNGNMLLVF